MRLPATWRSGRCLLGALAVVVVASTALGVPAAADEGAILRAGGPSAIADSYLVVLHEGAVAGNSVSTRAVQLADQYGGTVARTYRHALRGFEARLSEAEARRLAADPAVRYVQQNHTVRLAATQRPTPSWGLDRVDQRALPLDTSYTYPNSGAGVKAYIIDTGIMFTHFDFGGRAVNGFNSVEAGRTAHDCHGHGTHVAGTVGGTAHGVAKSVTLVAVKVIDCIGQGTIAGVIAGIDWVTGDHQPGQLAVANMSLGSAFDQATNDAVAASIADGVVYAIAAGNFANDACTLSPASAPEAITVGASEPNDVVADYSSIGPCLDIFAPGSGIASAWIEHDFSIETLSGTSMATPHVAGAAAIILAANPTFTPQQVRDKMVGDATTGVLPNPGPGSPNKLLYVSPTRDISLTVTPTVANLTLDDSLTATVSTTTTVGGPHTIALSATGLPAGATATFDPPSVTSGNSSTLTIATSAATTAHGDYQVTVTGAGPETTKVATIALTVRGRPGCLQTSNGDLNVPNMSTVESVMFVSGCAGNAAAGSAAEVHIVHPWRSDLQVNLVAPDGSTYLLHNTTGGDIDNVDQTYVVNLSSEAANGTWRLRVRDVTTPDTGHLTSWTLDLRPSTPPTPTPEPTPPAGSCAASNETDVPIPDRTTRESRITIAGCTGNARAGSTAEVHIVHQWLPSIVVTLVAPDGTVYPLHSGPGDGTGNNNIDRRYTVDLSSGRRNGTWRLRVQDVMTFDTGHIDRWTLTL